MRIALRPRGARARLACAVLITLGLAAASPSVAGAAFATGFQEDEYITGNDALRDWLFDRTVDENASVARINVIWRNVAPTRPANPADPADGAYRFGTIDAAVEAAAARGLKPLLMINRAPDFAEGAGRPGGVVAGSWKPDPSAFADFARAVARRYSGNFQGLPRVRYYQAWNEQNLAFWLSPQRQGKGLFSPSHYRRMLNAFYAAVKSVHKDNRVLTGGTAPYGDPGGNERVRPLAFLRKLLCLRGNLKKRSCKHKAKFDILAHHPITLFKSPTHRPRSRDDVTTAVFSRVRKTLRAAERLNTVTKGRHPLWATEIWWESDPPDTAVGRPLAQQARWLEQALYLLWRQGAKVVINFEVYDAVYSPAAPQSTIQSGVFFHDMRPKPSATAFAFPFVTDRKSKRKVLAWGIAPQKGKVKIQRKRGKGWRTIEKRHAGKGKVFTARLRLRGRARLRATVKGEQSLVWSQGR